MPARAPASIDMLQIVIRPSIDSASMALAAVLDDVALAAAGADLGDHREDDVLGGDALGQLAVDVDRHGLERLERQVWVASTCSTSEVPMPKASAPKAPWVEVWLSPQTMVMPGWVSPSCGPTTCTMPCSASPIG
jgi:hypothetical protein